MFVLIYYNINSDENHIEFDTLQLAKMQYELLKDKYQYCGIVDTIKNEVVLGKLLPTFL